MLSETAHMEPFRAAGELPMWSVGQCCVDSRSQLRGCCRLIFGGQGILLGLYLLANAVQDVGRRILRPNTMYVLSGRL